MADINKIIGIEIDDNASAGLKKVDQNLTKVTQSTKNLTQETKSNTQSVLDNGGAMGILNELTGGLAMTFKDASEAIGMAGVSLNSFKGIMLATGIGALVIAVGYLAENWEKVVDALDSATASQKAYNEAVTEANLKTRETNTALESLAINLPTNEVINSAADIQKYNIVLSELSKTLGVLSGLEFKLGDTENNKIVLDQVNSVIASYKTYNAALNQRDEIQEKLNEALKTESDARKELEKYERRAVESGFSKDVVAKEFREAVGEAAVTVSDLRQKLDQSNKNLIIQAESLKLNTDKINNYKKANEESNKAQQEGINLDKKRIEALTKLLNSYRIKSEDFDDKTDLSKLNRAEKRVLEELDLLKATEEQKKVIRDYYDKLRMDALNKEYELNKQKSKESLEKIADEEKKDLDARLSRTEGLYEIEAMQREANLVGWIEYWEDVKMVSETAQNFLTVLQDESLIKSQGLRDAFLILEKGFAVANVWINEAQASATAKFNASLVPYFIQAGPYTIPNPMKPVAVASAARTVVANKINAGIATAAIIAQTISGLNKGGSSSGSVDSGGAAAPQAQFNIVGSSGTNQLAATIGASQNQPVNAYVVGNDVSTQQSLDRNRINNATFL
jgi:hypothetical protein